MRGRPAPKEAAASLATVTSEEECCTCRLSRPEALSFQASRRWRAERQDAVSVWMELMLALDANAMLFAPPARNASGERHGPCGEADPRTSSLDCANLEPCASGSTRIFPLLRIPRGATLQNSRSPAVNRPHRAAPFGAHARPHRAASKPQGDFL
jgi:hypothetical protein